MGSTYQPSHREIWHLLSNYTPTHGYTRKDFESWECRACWESPRNAHDNFSATDYGRVITQPGRICDLDKKQVCLPWSSGKIQTASVLTATRVSTLGRATYLRSRYSPLYREQGAAIFSPVRQPSLSDRALARPRACRTALLDMRTTIRSARHRLCITPRCQFSAIDCICICNDAHMESPSILSQNN